MRKHKSLLIAVVISVFSVYFFVNNPQSASAMHIMEGFLPPGWALFWWLAFIPFFFLGIRSIIRVTKTAPELKLLLGLAGAFTFVLSALKLPSVAGSSSHPTGTGLGSVLFGPFAMSVLGSLVLLFQALFLAHGGLSTLGANAFSMAVVGPLVGYGIYKLLVKTTAKESLAVFSAAVLADFSAYVVTSFQLAVAFSATQGGLIAGFLKFAGIFAFTQIPLAIIEGLITVFVWKWLQTYSAPELKALQNKKEAMKLEA